MPEGRDARRVVVTGMGVVCPGGLSALDEWTSLLDGKALAHAPSSRELRRQAAAPFSLDAAWNRLVLNDVVRQEDPLLADRQWVTPSHFAPEPVNLSERDRWDPALPPALPLGPSAASLCTAAMDAWVASLTAWSSTRWDASSMLIATVCRPLPAAARYLRLRALWRRADPGRILLVLALLIRFGRLWTQFRPARPPGGLAAAACHTPRGPDAPRMTQSLVIRG